jgi:ankyrin repeat protein
MDAKRCVVRLLVKHGADLNVTAKFNLSALMLAIIGGHEDIARELVAAGVDLEARGSGAPGFSGKTAHDLALERGMRGLVELLGKR